METFATPLTGEPTLSTIEQEKREAGAFVAEEIRKCIQGGEMSPLAAARQVYESVKGNDYRREQAAAKILECLNLQNELDMRKEEILHSYPDAVGVLNGGFTGNAANDERYAVNQKAAA